MENKASSGQVMYAAANLIIATSLLTWELYIAAKNEAWIAIAAGVAASLCVLLVYIKLADRFTGLSLLWITDAVFGKILGKIVYALYLFFFFTLAALNVSVFGGFVKSFTLPSTPAYLVLAIFVLVSAWAVKKGSTNVLKYSAVIALSSIAVILLYTLLLVPTMDVRNLLPVFALPFRNYIIGTHSVTMLPLCDPFVLMMFLPVLRKPKEFGGAVAKGMLIGGLLMLVIALSNITVLGQSARIYPFPSMATIRQIDVGDVLTRLDIVYISIQIVLIFYKVTVLFYASVCGVGELFGFSPMRHLTGIMGVLLVVYAMSVFKSLSEHQEFLLNGAAPMYNMFFSVILPILTLITAFCRGLFRKADGTGDWAQ
jgi:spore germination protein KB